MGATIKLPIIRQKKKEDRNTIIRVSEDVYDAIEDLAFKTAMTKKQVTDILLRDAMSRVELVERKVYEMAMMEGEEDED